MRAMRHGLWALGALLIACGDSAGSTRDASAVTGSGDAGDAASMTLRDARPPIVTPPEAGPMAMDAGSDATFSDAEIDDADTPEADAGDASMQDASSTSPLGVPTSIRGTGLYADDSLTTIAKGVREFAPASFLWSDTATKRRWLYLPPGTQIDTSDMDNWQFPVGTKAFKEFTRDMVRVETRMIERTDTGWLMIAYAWNKAQTDAIALPNGDDNVMGTEHDIPAAGLCRDCHTDSLGGLLGVSAIQLSHDRGTLNFQQLANEGSLSDVPKGIVDYRPPAGMPWSALMYLHANCGNCHRPGTVAFDRVDMTLWLPVASVGDPALTPTYQTTIGVGLSETDPGYTTRVVPALPDASGMIHRMTLRDGLLQMPPLASELPDTDGIKLIRDWIGSL